MQEIIKCTAEVSLDALRKFMAVLAGRLDLRVLFPIPHPWNNALPYTSISKLVINNSQYVSRMSRVLKTVRLPLGGWTSTELMTTIEHTRNST